MTSLLIPEWMEMNPVLSLPQTTLPEAFVRKGAGRYLTWLEAVMVDSTSEVKPTISNLWGPRLQLPVLREVTAINLRFDMEDIRRDCPQVGWKALQQLQNFPTWGWTSMPCWLWKPILAHPKSFRCDHGRQ